MWKIYSPDQSLSVVIRQNEQDRLCYTIEQDGETILQDSLLGLTTNLGDFSTGLAPIGSATREIRETYTLPTGKKAVYDNNANELSVDFTYHNRPFTLRIRAFDDGAAFRYEVGSSGSDEETLTISGETTEFNFTQACDTLWLQDWIESYEGLYNPSGWQGTQDRAFGMPGLFTVGDKRRWVLLTEANVYNLNGSYCACHLRGAGDRRMAISFAPEQKEPIVAALPFHTPWRVVAVTRTLEALLDNTLTFNLNPPSIIEDTSWIQPGRNIWGWWFFDTGAQLYSEQKRYVDFAAAIGFESVTVDASWDATWIKDLCDYARDRNVSIWIWAAMEEIGTVEEAREKIARWADYGIVGLKVDFFINDSRHTMWQYNMIADIMTEHRLMINFHGCVRPGGEGRTYPNMLTFEGIMGLEHYKWSDLPHAEHNCTVPFTRNAVGPMDYTVTGYSNRNRNTSLAHQAALSVVFETGSQHFSASIYHLEAWNGTDFLRRLKPKFDGMRLLSGYPGDHAAILRYTKDEWFIGCITNPARELSVPLDFLPEGTFYAEIYRDGSTGDDLIKEVRQVTNRDTLDLSLLQGGGAAIYLSDGANELQGGIRSGHMLEPVIIRTASEAILSGDSALVRFESGEEAVQLAGSAQFSIQAPENKRYTARLVYGSEGPLTIQAATGEGCFEQTLEDAGGDRLFRSADMTVELRKGDNVLTVSALSGSLAYVREIAIIDNAPNVDYVHPATEGILSGGATLIPGKLDDEPQRVSGLGLGGELLFPEIVLPEDGYYLLTVHYYSGATLPLKIDVNGALAAESGLLDTSGEATPRWDIPSAKEVKLHCRKGANALRFYHETRPAVHISAISLRLDQAD